MSFGEEYSNFSTDMSMVTIFDQARKTEAQKSKAKNKATSKARGRSRNDVCT